MLMTTTALVEGRHITKGNYIRQYPKTRGNKNVSFSVGY